MIKWLCITTKTIDSINHVALYVTSAQASALTGLCTGNIQGKIMPS
ncbi:hypothetical protein M23134_02501 [Microscilla marina ATCC 23134]|uniref:Uncharacterized protein n=1 Tax=Microscilla marina ATCC 23134 TaxID=313606 RepID=A1ZTR7_MICM2|nr:hypothetical protein M23134_02501 [Microscilla marina ATCC 23134]